MGILKQLQQNQLGFQLTPVSVRDFAHIQFSPCEIYSFQNGIFIPVIKAGTRLNKEVIKDIILKGHWKFFTTFDDKAKLRDIHQESLRKVTRSLSVGNTVANSKKQIKLLTLNLEHLYDDPTNDDALELQQQSIKNLGAFLLENPKLNKELYQYIGQQNFHYTHEQPLLSSLVLLAFLKNTFHFSHKEMLNLFVTSYFKDIGMGFLPTELFNKKDLSEQEIKSISNHPASSHKILENRLSIPPAYLEIISNHHSHAPSDQDLEDDPGPEIITGIETTLVSTMDTITAMTTGRPYRDANSIYESLEIVKELIAKQHPQEFKFLVHFFSKFFK